MSFPKPGAPEAWHRYHVFHDSEFQSELAKMPTRKSEYPAYENLKYYDELGKKFDMKAAWIDFVHDRSFEMDPSKPKVSTSIEMKDDYGTISISLKMHPNITKRQFMGLWKDLNNIRNEAGFSSTRRYKAPEYTEILYAINRGRSAGMTFAKIFELYKSKSLPKYLKDENNLFDTTSELEKYYRKYYS